jgi:hypothetical protein
MSWTRNRKSIGFAVGFAFAAGGSMGHGSLAVAAQQQISFPANYSDVRLIHEKLLQALRLVYGPDVRLTNFGTIFPGGLTPQAKDQGLPLDYALPKAFTEERYMPFHQALKEVGIIQSADPRAEKKEAQIQKNRELGDFPLADLRGWVWENPADHRCWQVGFLFDPGDPTWARTMDIHLQRKSDVWCRWARRY